VGAAVGGDSGTNVLVTVTAPPSLTSTGFGSIVTELAPPFSGSVTSHSDPFATVTVWVPASVKVTVSTSGGNSGASTHVKTTVKVAPGGGVPTISLVTSTSTGA
jgi:hypothetical protein